MVQLIGKAALFFIDLFIQNKKNKEEYARRVMAALAKWDREAVKSSELRDMFDRIEKKMKESRNDTTS